MCSSYPIRDTPDYFASSAEAFQARSKRPEGALSPEGAWRAAHVDEDFQIGRWGEDDEAKRRRAARWRDFEAAARTLAAL
jgi:chaperone required for assembly of F1-ATPase